MNKFQKRILAAASVALLPALASAFPIAAVGTEGYSVIVTGTGDVMATYLGNSASYSNDLYLGVTASVSPGDEFIFNNHATPVGTVVDLGSFAVGTELIFRLHVNNTGDNWYSGAASRNDDGKAHARVQSEWQPGESLVSFEDLRGTPEGVNGYNDLSFSFTNTAGSPDSVPEPTTMALMGMGVIGMAVAARRKK